MNIGDMVVLPDSRIGVIEAIGDRVTVRIYVRNDDDFIATVELVDVSADEIKPIFDAVIDQLEQLEDDEPSQEFSVGDIVEYTSEGGDVIGEIIELSDDGVATIEVLERNDNGDYERTGVTVEQNVAILDKHEPVNVVEPAQKHRIMAKIREMKVTESEQIGIIEGYASTYGNTDLGGDVVEKGAFTQTLKHNNKTPLLFDHGWMTTDVAGVAYYEEDDKGLKLRAELPLWIPKVKQVFEMIKFMLAKGVKMGLSIGYQAIKYDYDANNIRHLRECALHESSVTPFPMNTEALITSAKARRLELQAKRLKWQIGYKRTKKNIDAVITNQELQDAIEALAELKQITQKLNVN